MNEELLLRHAKQQQNFKTETFADVNFQLGTRNKTICAHGIWQPKLLPRLLVTTLPTPSPNKVSTKLYM